MSILILFPLKLYYIYFGNTEDCFRVHFIYKNKAKKGTRTLNNNLGKVILYQLSYFRFYFFTINKEFKRINKFLLFVVFV
jgi:hypothetical protein